MLVFVDACGEITFVQDDLDKTVGNWFDIDTLGQTSSGRNAVTEENWILEDGCTSLSTKQTDELMKAIHSVVMAMVEEEG